MMTALLAFPLLLSQTVCHSVKQPPNKPKLSAWCPFFPEYPILAGGKIVLGCTDLDGGFTALVKRSFAEVNPEFAKNGFPLGQEVHEGYRAYHDPRGFQVSLAAKEAFANARLSGPMASIVEHMLADETLVEITREHPQGFWGDNWISGVYGEVSDTKEDIGLRVVSDEKVLGNLLTYALDVEGKCHYELPGAVVRHAYIEERDQWNKTVLTRHSAIALPKPSAPLGKHGKAHFDLAFRLDRSRKPVRHYIVYWVTCGEDENVI